MTGKTNPIIKTVIWAIIFMLLGAVIGFLSKWLDLNNEFFGNLFSRIMIWFVLCTAIAVYSKKPINAAVNVFTFCIGMLTAYYLTAIWWDAVWGKTFMYGWAAFSLCSPLFAFLTWYAKGKGILALLLKIGIILVSFAAETVLFGFRAYNLLFEIVLIYILFGNISPKGANNA